MEHKEVLNTLKKFEDTIVKEIDKMNAKGAITPADVDAGCKAIDLIKKIEETSTMIEWANEQDNPEVSGKRGRNMFTGRYTSMGMQPHNGSYGYYGNMASGHSINDRMVALLESMINESHSNYERERINDVIQMIQSL